MIATRIWSLVRHRTKPFVAATVCIGIVWSAGSWGAVPLSSSAAQASQTVAPVFQSKTSSDATAAEPYDRVTLLILAPGGPVLADLRISVAQRPYRVWLGTFLARQLDVDRSGTLSEDELAVMTTRVLTLVGAKDASSILRMVSRADQAGSIPAADFVDWLGKRLPKSFFISALPKAADEVVRLTTLIDLDQDDSVSTEELASAMRTLRFRDLDDDQTFSISELLPYRDPRSQDARLAPEAASLPFIEITDATSAKKAARRLLTRYGRSEDENEARSLPCHLLRLSKDDEDAIDGDSNSRLSRAELQKWLLGKDFHLTIDVKLSDLANNSDVVMSVAPKAESFAVASRVVFGSQKVVIDGMPLTVVARGGGANNRAVTRGFLGQSFVMSDGDRNQYLDSTEFAMFAASLQQAGVAAEFTDVDSDHNEMIVRDEIYKFVERESIAVNSRIEVTVEQEGKTLFSLLDANADRRLTEREFIEGFTRLSDYDVSRDDRFAESELGTEFTLTIGLGQSDIRRNNAPEMAMMNSPQRQTDAILPGAAAGAGPEWFRRMDRNQDGDVNRREFIGTAAMFNEMDRSGDGLISAAEATAVSQQ